MNMRGRRVLGTPASATSCSPGRGSAESSPQTHAPPGALIGDDLLMYGLPDNFTLMSFHDATLLQVSIGQHQVSLLFDGDNRGVSIESRYAVQGTAGEPEEFTAAAAGAAALAAILGAQLEHVAGTPDGTLTLSFSTGAKVVIFDDSTNYESYQIPDGEQLIVV
jgi:hypothetical protein